MEAQSVGRARPFSSMAIRSIGGILIAGAVNNIAAFIMTMLVARELGPRDFGQLGVMLAVMMFAGSILDCGTSVSAVRSYKNDIGGRSTLLRTMLGWKWLLAVAVTACAWPAADIGSGLFFGGNGATRAEFTWTIAGAGLMAVWVSVRALFQAREEFVALSVVTYIYAGMRGIALVGAVLMQRRDAADFFVAIYVVPLLIILPAASLVLLRRSGMERTEGDGGGLDQACRRIGGLLGYGRWVAISSIAYASLWRLPQFRLSHAGGSEELGYYTVGLTFVAVFTLLNDSVRTVMLPRVAAMNGNEDRQNFRSAIRRWVGLYYVGMALLVAFLVMVQVLVLGEQYRLGVPIFLVLSLGVTLTLHAGLLNSLVHSHGVPHLDAGANVLKVLVLGAVFFVIPARGLEVAAAFALVMALGEWSLTLVVRRREAHNGIA